MNGDKFNLDDGWKCWVDGDIISGMTVETSSEWWQGLWDDGSGRMNAEKRKQIEQIESLTEEKSERMRLSDAGVERTELWQRWRTLSDNVFFAKSKGMRGRVWFL